MSVVPGGRTTLALVALLAVATSSPRAGQPPAPAVAALADPIAATAHPSLPRDPLQLWLAPTEAPPRASSAFGRGARLHAAAKYAEALPLVRTPIPNSPLADYAQYYTGLTELRLQRLDEAQRTFTALAARPLVGYLAEAVRLRSAEVKEAQGDHRGAAAIYAELAKATTLAPEDVLLRLARASQAAGDLPGAAAAWARVYFEFPLSDQAAIAQAQMDTLGLWQPVERGNDRYAAELGRAERLFAARRYADARASFELVESHAAGDDAELVALRLAESDYYLKRYAAARAALEPWTTKAARRAEAQFFFLGALRELGHHEEYVRLARELVNAWPKESWAEEALNNLATHFILVDDRPRANGVFREIVERFPSGRHAPRAYWRAGWWEYRAGRFAEAARFFEAGAARFPRSDYRPMWLYWAARAHDQLGDRDAAQARYAVVAADYQNSYYGRLATTVLAERGARPAAVQPAVAPDSASAALPPSDAIIRQLLAHELYEDALRELQYAQKAWGDSAAIQATIGLVHSKMGDLRRGINAMKRAYPQYIAAGGEQLPVDMLEVLFPVDYWDLIKRYSAAHGLDPYLIAALMAQESTFDADIKSHANAVGLMQVLPSTGKRYARRVGIRRFRPSMLTRPEVNVRLGTAIFADLVKRFGGTHLALASYNAGEGAVGRWVEERPDLPRDEFIDDIPYPETQNYVKKIVGTAEDYRRLYGELGASGRRSTSAVSPAGRPGTAKASAAKTGSKKAPAKKAAPKKKTTTKKGTAKSAPATKSAGQRN